MVNTRSSMKRRSTEDGEDLAQIKVEPNGADPTPKKVRFNESADHTPKNGRLKKTSDGTF